jgi:hypothetical protein
MSRFSTNRIFLIFSFTAMLTACSESDSETPPSGPTAEETVAFLLHGVEDGSTIAGPGGQDISFVQESKSPALYRAKANSINAEIVITTTKDSECIYRTNFEKIFKGRSEKFELEADFSKIRSITSKRGGDFGVVKIEGGNILCNYNENKECPTMNESQHIKPDNERLKKALDYFNSKYCSRPY